MKTIKRRIIKITDFMPFIGKILEIQENSFIVYYGINTHSHQEFYFEDMKVSETGIKVGDIIYIAMGGMIVLENEDEIKQAYCSHHEISLENFPGWEWDFEKRLKEMKKAKLE